MISGRVRALNLTVPLGSGRVGSDDLGYGPGSGFSFEPVQTSTCTAFIYCLYEEVCIPNSHGENRMSFPTLKLPQQCLNISQQYWLTSYLKIYT